VIYNDFHQRYILKTVVMSVLAVIMMSGCSSMNKSKQDQSSNSNKSDNKSPSLTTPKVRKVWVPEKIEGDKYIEGHWMWVLERTTTWSQ
jgi:hypothetical protein